MMLLKLDGKVLFTYHGTPRKGEVVELRPKHDMVLIKVGHGQFRNFKISKMTDLRMLDDNEEDQHILEQEREYCKRYGL